MRRSAVPPVPNPDPSPLLLASGLSPDEVVRLLTPYGFTDASRADANIQAVAGEPHARARFSAIFPELLSAVAQTADPDQALNHWERFLQAGLNRAQLFDYLKSAPRMLHVLCSIFGNSDALAQTLIRDPLLIYWLAEEQVLNRMPTSGELDRMAREAVRNVTAVELKQEALRRIKRREMLRIGVRDLLKLADVPETTAALSDLAAVLIQQAYDTVDAEIRQQYGAPAYRARNGRQVENGFSVIAMGKLGGHELNFSSDVDLIYVYASDEGRTKPVRGASATRFLRSISSEEYFEYLARELTRALAEPMQEGYVFRVDLRLRAEGTMGKLARSVDGYRRYYRQRGEAWERLALLKAAPIAGDPAVGRAFLAAVRPFVFQADRRKIERADAVRIVEDVRSVKDMIDQKTERRGHARRNVKLGIGGIREIEFVVQAAQVLCGATSADLRVRNTLSAVRSLKTRRLLSAGDADALSRAYLFLRDVEHKLQMVHDLQTHALPESDEEMTRCAIRLGYAADDRSASRRRFLADLERHTGRAHRIFRSLFHAPARSPLVKAALALARKPR